MCIRDSYSADIYSHVRLLRGFGKRSCHPERLVPQKCGGLDLGSRKYGLRLWWNVLQPGYRMACRPLFIQASLRVIRANSYHRRRSDLVAA